MPQRQWLSSFALIHSMTHRYLFFLFCLLLGFSPAMAQLSVQFPVSRFVTQRGLDNQGTLFIAASLTETADRVEAQLVPVAAGQGVATAWQTIQTNATTGQLAGSITGTGGWYTLTVRAVRSGVTVAQTTVQPVGIGEVFIVAGQSNSRGFGIGDNDVGAISDRVSSFDTINYYLPEGSSVIYAPDSPMPYVPSYTPLTAGKRVFPMGESSWGWGELGDYIVNRLNVPVMFYNIGWDASTIDNWNGTSRGRPGCNILYCMQNWPYLQPYTNLRQIMGYYGATGGFRAVLWHQGEMENVDKSTIPLYAPRLDSLIRKIRQDFNNRSMPWVVARASFTGQVTNPDVIEQQRKVIQTPNFNVFEGPLNDTILNRHGGQIDVHFSNALRPSPHPQYYLNPQRIPADMGLSRFARNWNTSLTDGFFQTASPVVPVLFAATGVAKAVNGGAFAVGDSVQVAFTQLGTFNAGNQWDVQILDEKGRFRATVGRGTTSPIRVRWPDSLTVGTYRVRVVSTNPVVAGSASASFAVRTSADLSLNCVASRRLTAVNDTATLYVQVSNAGSAQAVNGQWRCRLPDNMFAVAVSSGVIVSAGVVTGTFANLDAGRQVTMAFRVQAAQDGLYQVAAEINQVDNADPDSQPGSGTGDGQDDAAMVELKVGNGANRFASPNPNQVPLPTVRGNQPTPVANLADLSLAMQVSNRTPAIGEIVTYTLIVTNVGGAASSNVNATAYLPDGLQFVNSNNMAAGGGGITGTLLSLPAATSGLLSFSARATATGSKLVMAQIRVATPADPDSTPGNGYPTSTGEDDEAAVELRVRD